LIQQPHDPLPNPKPPDLLTQGTSSFQWVITPAAYPSNTTALSQASPLHTALIIPSSMPLHTSSRTSKGGRDTSARMRSTIRCSPGQRDSNRRAANSFSSSGVPGVDQARGPREKRTSQHRAICHFSTSLLLSYLSTPVGSLPISTSNPSSSSHTRISPTLSLPRSGTKPPSKACNDRLPNRRAWTTTRGSVE
ncbi:uncharacterized protein LACBIDRAFT_304708, partial [Laccaria bicolor S238N-H82]